MSSSLSLNPDTLTNVTMYSTQYCPYCVAAKRLLNSKGISFEEIDVGSNPEQRRHMETISQRRTVPQIFAGEQHIGGFTDLAALLGQ